MKFFVKIFFVIILIINTLTLFAQSETETKITTYDGNVYIGIIISETDAFIKMAIGGRDIIQIQQSNILTKTPYERRRRRHTISVNFSNYNWESRLVGLNYDFNFYQKADLLIGGTVGVGVSAFQTGIYTGFRQPSQDILKIEVGMGASNGRFNNFSGSYVELAYRSQRNNRLLYWEVNSGFLVNIFEKRNTIFGLPYGGIAVGINF